MLGFAIPFVSQSSYAIMLGQNHSAEPNWHLFTFQFSFAGLCVERMSIMELVYMMT